MQETLASDQESSRLPSGRAEPILILHSGQGLRSIPPHRDRSGTGILLTTSVGCNGTILDRGGNALTQLPGTTAWQFHPSLGCSHARLVATHGPGVTAGFFHQVQAVQQLPLMQSR